MSKNISIFICAFITAFFFMNAFASLSNCQLPENVMNITAKLGCERVPGFYERPGIVNKEYVIGELFVKGVKDTVFWCFSKNENIYNLVIVKDKNVFDVLKFDNYPGGLSIIEKDKINLKGFKQYPKNSVSNESDELNDVTLIKSEYDGIIMYVVWHRGSWYYQILH